MQLTFAKLHGLGNDFVMVDDMENSIHLTDEQVAAICDRHFGVGGDGVILVRPSDRPECAGYMHYINSDGTLAQMCGNGVRCFAKFMVDRGMVHSDECAFVADTLAGPKPISYTVDADGKMTEATVNMGNPILVPQEVPTTLSPNAQTDGGVPFAKEQPIASPWGEFAFTCVSMGNPHAITFIDDFEMLPDVLFKDPSNKCLRTFDVDMVGAFFEKHEAFPEKTNVEFAHVGVDGIEMRVFERGCGETLACGTGTCATNVAACLTRRAGRENDVTLLGGVLHINWTEEGPVMMTGAAVQSFTGTIEI